MLIEGPEKKSSPYQNMVRHLHTTKEIHHEATERFPESTGWAVERTIESLKRRDYNSPFVLCRGCCSSKERPLEAETLHRYRGNTLGIACPRREPHGCSSL